MSDDYLHDTTVVSFLPIQPVCFKCGACVMEDQPYCQQCGMQNPTLHEKQCRKCSHIIVRTCGWMYFCPQCGTPITYERSFSAFDRLRLPDRIVWYKNPANWGLSHRAAVQLVNHGITPDHALLMRKGDFITLKGIGERITQEVMRKRRFMY